MRKQKLLSKGRRAPLTRSQIMARISRRDTWPELFARTVATSLGQRYRIDVRNLPGAPDLANRRRQWAIFVHGCFWHQHKGCQLASSPRSNSDYWTPKLTGNRKRDSRNIRELESRGFRVLVLWECECRKKAPAMQALESFFAEIHLTNQGR